MVTYKKRDFVIEHPNQEKASSKLMRLLVFLLLVGSAVLIGVIAIGGWSKESGAQALTVAYAAIYLLLAFYVLRWRSGVLPLAAALGTFMLIFAAVSAPGWFDRDKTGFTDPSIPAGLLGTLTVIVIPVQLALIVAAMRGFQQRWTVEVERYPDGTTAAAT